MSVHSITVGFSPILYCWPYVTTLGNSSNALKSFVLAVNALIPPKPFDCSEGLHAFRFCFKAAVRVACFFGVFRFTENMESLFFPGLSGTLLIYALVLIGRTDRG